MAEYKIKGMKNVEDAVVGTYQKIEDAVVGAYKKIEDKFVDTFLEKVDEEENNSEGSSRR